MRHIILICLLSSSLFGLASEGEAPRNIYSGGMHIFQPSFVSYKNPLDEIHTYGSGIGGIMRFYLWSNFAAGFYGGRHTAEYDTNGSENSYISLGHGGGFVGLTHKSGKFRYSLSMGVGGGTIKNLHIVEQQVDVLADAHFYKYSTMVLLPFTSVDYSLTRRLLITLQASYFMADNMNYTAPSLQIGLLFNR
ncbi:MAG: hypothetical protein KGZ97_02545 [Bacteroidetes bacterium]|nr:hypothetical protein [Bacteroidota bacterium]